jgi:cytochrome c oxidase assembly protein subunit 15
MSSPTTATGATSPDLPAATGSGGLRRLALASIVVNVMIVVTGGAVRLTGSGLGCPTWPRCSAHSFVPTGELGLHSQIEFTNRMLTYVVAGVALATLVSARRVRPARRDLRRLSWALFVGIPAQAVLGGITVLTGLNPWVVMGHLLISMDLIALATVLYARVARYPGESVPLVEPALRRLILGVLGLTGAVLYLGAVVTGSGPHAGAAEAPRTGLDTRLTSLLHAGAVAVLLVVTLLLNVLLRRRGAPAAVRRAAAIVLAVQLLQGAIGSAQYLTGLPRVLVGLHMLGAGLLVVATMRLVLAARPRPSGAPGLLDQRKSSDQLRGSIGSAGDLSLNPL